LAQRNCVIHQLRELGNRDSGRFLLCGLLMSKILYQVLVVSLQRRRDLPLFSRKPRRSQPLDHIRRPQRAVAGGWGRDILFPLRPCFIATIPVSPDAGLNSN